MRSEQINELVTALAKAQGAMKPAAFNRINPHFKSKYADLTSITAAAQEPLSANGLSITQTIELGEMGSTLITTLWHASGQYIQSEYPINMAGRPQEIGSMLTYARRYGLSALLGIVSEDDDGNGAEEEHKKKPPAPAARVVPPAMRGRANPETGEVVPHEITSADDEAWGQEFISELRFAKDEAAVDKWVLVNKQRLMQIENDNIKLYKVISGAAKTKREALALAKSDEEGPR